MPVVAVQADPEQVVAVSVAEAGAAGRFASIVRRGMWGRSGVPVRRALRVLRFVFIP